MKRLFTILTFIVITTSIHAQNVGVGTATPLSKLDIAGGLSLKEGTALGLANGANNNIPVANWSSYRITGPTAVFSVTGMAPATVSDGFVMTLINNSGQIMTVSNENAGSAAANRIRTQTGADITIADNGAIQLIYNGTTQRWHTTSAGIPSGSSAWDLMGNATTNPAVNFIGTTDAQSLVLRTNSTEAMRILTDGNIGIGTPTPTDRLEVAREGSTDLGMHFGWNKMVLTNLHNMGSPNGGGHSIGSKILFKGYKDAALFAPQNIYSLGTDVFGDGPSGVEKNNFFIRDEYAPGTPVRMLIDATGNVGIGTTAPGSLFSVNHTTDPRMEFTSTAGLTYLSKVTGGWFGLTDPFIIQSNSTGDMCFTPVLNTPANGMVIKQSGNVGIGNITPTEILDVTGNLKFSQALMPNNLPGAVGQVLTSQGAGVAPIWTAAGAGNAWDLTGNAGTVDGTNFIGTTDDIPLTFRMNNVLAGRVEGIGAAPQQRNTSLGSENLSFNFGLDNTAIGFWSLLFNDAGLGNTGVGYQTLISNTAGNYNTANGWFALGSNTAGNFNTAVGFSALSGTDADNNTAIGNEAGSGNGSGTMNSFLGHKADVSGAAFNNATAIGANAYVGASNSMVLGSINGTNGATAHTFVGIGTTTPSTKLHISSTTSPAFRLVDGTQGAGKVLTSDALGNASWQAAGAGGNNWALLGNAGTVDGTNFLGTTDAIPMNFRVNNNKAGRIEWDGTTANFFSGYQSGNVNTGVRNYFDGYQAGFANTSGSQNHFSGYQAGYNNTTATNNTAVGYQTLFSNTTGTENVAMGRHSLTQNTIGNYNTATGCSTLYFNTAGSGNVANGYYILRSNTTGNNNTGSGYDALRNNTTGGQNTAIGQGALTNSTIGDNNTAIGAKTGMINSSGTYNTFVGYFANATAGNFTNATAIGANAYVGASNSLVLGSINGVNAATADVFVGIGTTTPSTKLHISSTTSPAFRLVDGTQAAGRVLTSDASGNASWQAAGAGNAWNITGNAGTVDGTNFIGTTDDIPFNFRINNVKAGKVERYTGAAGHLGNTTLGYQTLLANTTGYNNVAMGRETFISNTTGGNNVAIGAFSMNSSTTGNENTAIGAATLRQNSTGYHNAAMGFGALNVNTSGFYNTAIGGYNVMPSNTTGDRNTAIGTFSFTFNTTGSSNTGVGVEALYYNVSGNNATAIGARAMYYANNQAGGFTNNNVAVGYEALRGSTTAANNTGNNNTAIGYQTMYNNTTGNWNTASGQQALYSNTSGNNNAATGNNALFSNTTGYLNTANGKDALFSNTSGYVNTAIGSNTLVSNSTGQQNTAIGGSALFSNTTANGNTATGYATLAQNTTGSYNTANGWSTLLNTTTGSNNTANGSNALYFNTSGTNNTASGYNALRFNSTGDENIAIGYNTANDPGVTASTQCTYIGTSIAPSANYNNAIAVGYGITNAQMASNKIRMGNASITNADVQVAWTVTSDKTQKSDVKYDVPGLELITKLQPATYFYNSHLKAHGNNAIRYNGLLAQDVDKVLTDMGLVSSIVSKPNADGSGSWGIRYAELTLPLIKAVQELKVENDALKAKVTELEAANNKQANETAQFKAETEARFKQLEAKMGLEAKNK